MDFFLYCGGPFLWIPLARSPACPALNPVLLLVFKTCITKTPAYKSHFHYSKKKSGSFFFFTTFQYPIELKFRKVNRASWRHILFKFRKGHFFNYSIIIK